MTSGASEMIFMNFLSRNSRATGPNIRVPRGLFSLSMMTMALLSKRKYEPADLLARAHHHRIHHLALLDGSIRRGLLDVGLDDVADARVALVAANDPDGRRPFGAGIVGHVQYGSNL